MADVNRGARPLSPHLMVYRPQITSISSIFIRLTGNALIVAAAMLVWWFVALASGPDAFATADGVVRSWVGDIVLLLSVWALFYHLLGGLRHLYWDTGRGLDLKTAERLGYGLFVGATVLTVLCVILFAIW